MRIVIVLALLALSGCASAPRPAAFGGQIILGADCREITGKYLNSASHSTGEGAESMSSLLGRIVPDPAAKSAPVSFTGTETLVFSRTTGNYLMVRRSSVRLAPAGGGISLPGMREDWYVFTPL